MLTELCITGELIDAQQALVCGLINAVAEDLDAGVQRLLSRITDKSPAAIRRGLYLMKHIEALPFEAAMAFTEGQIGLFALTEDAAEGQAAFREKRPPHWIGR
jgi:enoyl-CoA hydratase/carnithine racemase